MRLSKEQFDFLLTHCGTTTFLFPESLPSEARTFFSMEDLEWKVTRSGSHFFDYDTMRWWKSKVSTELYDWRYFITSEKPPTGPREYSVRWVYKYNDSPRLQVGRFDTRFSTLSQAKGFARRVVQTLPRVCQSTMSENHSEDLLTVFDGDCPKTLCGYHEMRSRTNA